VERWESAEIGHPDEPKDQEDRAEDEQRRGTWEHLLGMSFSEDRHHGAIIAQACAR
jgi:hypothetical protein